MELIFMWPILKSFRVLCSPQRHLTNEEKKINTDGYWDDFGLLGWPLTHFGLVTPLAPFTNMV